MNKTQIKQISREFKIPEADIRRCLARLNSLKDTQDSEIISEQNSASSTSTNPTEDVPEIAPSKIISGNYFYFLKEDYGHLLEKIETIRTEIGRLGSMIAHSVDVSGETFHDNFDYDEGNRQQDMWAKEIQKLEVIKQKARVIDLSFNLQKSVSIGKKVQLIKDGHEMNIKIGSYMTFNKKSISYASEFARNIMDMQEGEHKKFLIHKKNVEVTVVKILS